MLPSSHCCALLGEGFWLSLATLHSVNSKTFGLVACPEFADVHSSKVRWWKMAKVCSSSLSM